MASIAHECCFHIHFIHKPSATEYINDFKYRIIYLAFRSCNCHKKSHKSEITIITGNIKCV